MPTANHASMFVASNEAFCGNKITEPGEECDCGFENECNTTASCCVPRQEGQSGGNMCKLNPGAECRWGEFITFLGDEII